MSEHNPSPESQIARWTREDYQTEAPYEWLYGFGDDAFEMERLRGLMTADARAKKAVGAQRLWREYVKRRRREEAAAREEAQAARARGKTAFTGQPLALSCGEYACTDGGITRPNPYGGSQAVCPHPILPVGRLVNIETGECRTELAFRREGPWRRAVFDKATLSNARQITALAAQGISVTSESAKELVRYLAALEDENYAALPEIKTVGRLGWVQGYGFSPYVQGLTYDGLGLYGDAFAAVRAQGSREQWLNLAKAVRAGRSVPARAALAASFASPLVEPTGALPFILHLWGSTSGIGKSVALMLAASVWAYPDIGCYVRSTRSTDVGAEQLAAFCGNLPLCLDELQLIQGRQDFDQLIYLLCEGVSKTRGAKTGGMQAAQRWRNAVITTGEQPITTAASRAGAVNRVVEVECTAKLFDDPRAVYLTLVRNYGFAGRDFVRGLERYPDAMALARDLQQQFYRELEGAVTDKQALSASLILAADAMAGLLLFDDGCSLRAGDLLPYLVTPEAADANVRAYEWLCDFIAANPGRFAPGGDYAGERWGHVDHKAGVAYIIKSVFQREMAAHGFHPEAFLSWADMAGKLEKQAGKHTKTRRVGGVITRCVALRLRPEEGGVTP